MEQNILDWLTLLLNERISKDLSLENKQNHIILKAKNYKETIIFDQLQKDFLKPNSDLKCNRWRPETEGFVSPSDKALFAPTSNSLNYPIIEKKVNQYIIHYDILGLVYWTLNRLEELNSKNLDRFGRFDHRYSHAYLNGYLDQPIIDHWLIILLQVIKRIWPKLKINQKSFEIILSHDVDRPFITYCGKNFHSFIRNVGSNLLRGKISYYYSFLKSCLYHQNLAFYKDPYDSFEWLMNVAEKYNLKSTFNFIFGGQHFLDSYYSVKHKKISQLINRIYLRGHHIGAHLSFNSFNKENLIFNEIKNFKSYLQLNNINLPEISTRMHYLRWSSPDTLVFLDKAGVNRDTTLGFSGVSGFRCGTCHPFTGYDSMTNKILKIKISPLICMDTTLIRNKNLNYNNSFETIHHLKQQCKKVNGQFTLLWHNCNLIEKENKYFFDKICDG